MSFAQTIAGDKFLNVTFPKLVKWTNFLPFFTVNVFSISGF